MVVIVCETMYLYNKKHGTETKYHYDEIECETQYINGKKHGVDKWYDEDENLIKEIHYVNG